MSLHVHTHMEVDSYYKNDVCKASRCRKKRKSLIQDLEQRARDVSQLNETLTEQLECVTGQFERALEELSRFKRGGHQRRTNVVCDVCGSGVARDSGQSRSDS